MIPDRLLWQPWMPTWFPGVTPDRMSEFTVGQLVGMVEFAQEHPK